MKSKLIDMFAGNVVHAWDENGKNGEPQGVCFYVDNVLNSNRTHSPTSNNKVILSGRVFILITKRNYWLKPTYRTLKEVLISMREVAMDRHITKIAMSTIGCGLDRLEWVKVSALIKEIFENTNIEILVCKQ